MLRLGHAFRRFADIGGTPVKPFTLSSILVVAVSIEAACVPLSSREPPVPRQGVSGVQPQPAPLQTTPNQPASVPASSTPTPTAQPKTDAVPRDASAEKPEAQTTSGLDAELTKY